MQAMTSKDGIGHGRVARLKDPDGNAFAVEQEEKP